MRRVETHMRPSPLIEYRHWIDLDSLTDRMMELPGFGISEPNKAPKGHFKVTTSCGSPSCAHRSPTPLKLSTSITQ